MRWQLRVLSLRLIASVSPAEPVACEFGDCSFSVSADTGYYMLQVDSSVGKFSSEGVSTPQTSTNNVDELNATRTLSAQSGLLQSSMSSNCYNPPCNPLEPSAFREAILNPGSEARVWRGGAPEHQALALEFQDVVLSEGRIGGKVTISRARDESDVTHYNIHWAVNGTMASLIQSISKYKADPNDELVVDLTDVAGTQAGLRIPAGVNQLGVLTYNEQGEMDNGPKVSIYDRVDLPQLDVFDGTVLVPYIKDTHGAINFTKNVANYGINFTKHASGDYTAEAGLSPWGQLEDYTLMHLAGLAIGDQAHPDMENGDQAHPEMVHPESETWIVPTNDRRRV